jgi:hypothetical protein
MISRRLSIDPALLVSMFSRPDAWRVIANRLPEDAKVDDIDFDSCRNNFHVWITSSVFRDDDPVDLPVVEFEALPMMMPYDPNTPMSYQATCESGKLVLTNRSYTDQRIQS